MPMRSLQQCRACRLTWFPQGGAVAACPACGGTRIGGTLELFHAGLALIAMGLAGWFLRHGPMSQFPPVVIPSAPAQTKPLAAVQTKPSATNVERGHQVYVSSKKIKPAKVKPTKVKRRLKKAKTRSKHVQR